MEVIVALIFGLIVLPATEAKAQVVVPHGITAGEADNRYVNSPSESVAQTFTSNLTVGGSAFSVGGSTLAVSGGNVGIGTTAPATKLHMSSGTLTIDGTGARFNNSGFSKLGESSPSIKLIKLSTTTAAAEGGATTAAHGLNRLKILDVSVLVDIGSYSILPGDTYIGAGYEYGMYLSESAVTLQLHATNSENILNKTAYIYVVYEE